MQRDTGEEGSTLRSKETLTQATTWMNLENAARSEIQKDKSHMTALYLRCGEERSSLRQEVEWWQPGTGGGAMGVSVSWRRSFSLENEKVLEKDGVMVAQQCECA